MSVFAITFRFKDDSDRDKRYASFMEYFEGKIVWEETTSFVLLETTESVSQVASSLYLTSFSPSRDKLLVIDVTDATASAKGDIKLPNRLKRLLPKVVIS